MTTTNNNEDLEKKIIEAAKELFIENGFAETSMSDIAAKVGINRPALHYYFRTKDKMFQAVFGNIILSFIVIYQISIYYILCILIFFLFIFYNSTYSYIYIRIYII